MSNEHHERTFTICFIALGVYPLLNEKSPERVVGPDVNQFILGNELKKYNMKIVFICYDDQISKVEVEYLKNIEIIKIPKVNKNFILNYIMKTIFMIKAIIKADSDIYFHHIPGLSTIIRLKNKKTIYRVGSDAIVNKNLIKRKIKEFDSSKFSLSSFLLYLEFKLATAVVVQSKYQQRMLKKNFNRSGDIIRKTFPISYNNFREKSGKPIILWVGSMAEVKQPELFLELAKKIPEAKFKMIGGHSNNILFYNKIKDASKDISNLDFLGAIPFNEVDNYFKEASILVNTSLFEAYPNFVILQAWINYLPVVSLGDNSDNIISKNNIGFHSKTFKKMVKDVRKLLKDDNLKESMGKNGRRYVENNHDINSVIPKYIKLFYSILED